MDNVARARSVAMRMPACTYLAMISWRDQPSAPTVGAICTALQIKSPMDEKVRNVPVVNKTRRELGDRRSGRSVRQKESLISRVDTMYKARPPKVTVGVG
jgi:hypothetical protein